MSRMQRITAVTALVFFGFTGNSFADDCAANLDANSPVSVIIACLQSKESEIATLRLVKGEKGDKGDVGEKGSIGPEGPAGPKGDPVFVPAGAVIAFDLPDGCPEGWSLFTEASGHFIIGVGGKYELPYVAGKPKYQTGGSETHVLTIAEMPSHDHGAIWGGTSQKAGMNNPNAYHTSGYKQMQAQGSGKAHENMPPYIALYQCKKN